MIHFNKFKIEFINKVNYINMKNEKKKHYLSSHLEKNQKIYQFINYTFFE